MGVGSLFPSSDDRMRGNSLKLLQGGLDWILGDISSLKGLSSAGTGFPGKWWSHHPWRYLKVCVDVVLRGMDVECQSSCGCPSLAGFKARLDQAWSTLGWWQGGGTR